MDDVIPQEQSPGEDTANASRLLCQRDEIVDQGLRGALRGQCGCHVGVGPVE
jgi:hypothetical protein